MMSSSKPDRRNILKDQARQRSRTENDEDIRSTNGSSSGSILPMEEALPTMLAYPSFRYYSPGEAQRKSGTKKDFLGIEDFVEEEELELAASTCPTKEYYATLKEHLTEQQWHEIGQGPFPYGASNDVDVMINQLTALLGYRLKELLLSGQSSRIPIQTQLDMLTPDVEGKGPDLIPQLWENLRAYVDRIAAGYNQVFFHSVEHCTHVTIGMNKLLSMLVRPDEMEYPTKIPQKGGGASEYIVSPVDNDELTKSPNLRPFRRRRSTLMHVPINEQALTLQQPEKREDDSKGSAPSSNRRQGYKARFSRKSTGDLTADFENSNTDGDQNTRSIVDQVTFGIGTDAMLRFALLFSALVHDVAHQGVPNATLVEEEDDLAILHNDISVAEQTSLQVAFSTLNLQEFALLKSAIMPTKEVRKKFRKLVIDLVLVTDISNPERMQINKSKWKEAFMDDTEEQINDRQVANQNQIDNGESVAAHTHKETKEAVERRRHTMYASKISRRQLQNARIGIRQSLQLNGKIIDAYASTSEGQRRLRQDAVMDLMMNIADVGHTMQGFSSFVKWNRRLYKELLYAYHHDRTAWDPTDGWYSNQINFFDFYIIPLAEKMDACGVFGHNSTVFLYFAMENKRRWMREGQQITDEMVQTVGRELLLLTTARYMQEQDSESEE